MADIKLQKTYDFSTVEGRLYEWWEQQGYFRPRGEGDPFVISMPPPNITGELHLGHAITTAIEDLIIRHSRMKGVPSLWVPLLPRPAAIFLTHDHDDHVDSAR